LFQRGLFQRVEPVEIDSETDLDRGVGLIRQGIKSAASARVVRECFCRKRVKVAMRRVLTLLFALGMAFPVFAERAVAQEGSGNLVPGGWLMPPPIPEFEPIPPPPDPPEFAPAARAAPPKQAPRPAPAVGRAGPPTPDGKVRF
jgi:hypothetical protein